VTSTPPPIVRYQLGDAAVDRRASAAAIVGGVTALAPILLTIELLPRVGVVPPAVLWPVGAAIVALIVTRTLVHRASLRRRLAGMRITIDDDAIATETARDSLTIPRTMVARIVEIDGALGGVRVESVPDPRSGDVLVASVPRGGEGFGDARAALERWRPIERRARPGVGVRLLFGVVVVAAVFFLPFVLDDLVARSRFIALGLVLVAWAVTRWTMRSR
jgi:hypothetical protein